LRPRQQKVLGPIPWKLRQDIYPVSSYRPLPTGEPKGIPSIQASTFSESESLKTQRAERAQAVKNSFVKSWKAYRKYAWLEDEVTPISGSSRETFGGCMYLYFPLLLLNYHSFVFGKQIEISIFY
jgi:mannosyl-oligosaccharide alpha-1,2-mannosidase